MAALVGVFAASHSPFCYMAPAVWNEGRSRRPIREDVPLDDQASNLSKGQRIRDGFATLKERLAAVRPDVLVIFGDDQLECFDFTTQPAIAVYVGERFEGNVPSGSGDIPSAEGRTDIPRMAESLVNHRVSIPGHPQLGVEILTGLLRRHFDPAYLMDMPKPEPGVGHAIMRPSGSLTDLDIPTVPILLNCYYAPQITAARCYELGRAVRQIIDTSPLDLRVAVIGSGGLWHTPGSKAAHLDERFDQAMLDYARRGDARGMAEHFDSYVIPEDDASQLRYLNEKSRRITGLPTLGGPQGGTRETCNWIAAAAVADGCKATVVDYIPVYASPIGVGFAYWDID